MECASLKLGFVFAALVVVAAGPGWADTESLLKSIFGKNLTNAQVTESYIRSDGTLEGVYKGQRYTGTWKLKGGKYCREIPAFKANGCQTIVGITNDAGKVVAVEFLDQGKTKGNRYTIN